MNLDDLYDGLIDKDIRSETFMGMYRHIYTIDPDYDGGDPEMDFCADVNALMESSLLEFQGTEEFMVSIEKVAEIGNDPYESRTNDLSAITLRVSIDGYEDLFFTIEGKYVEYYGTEWNDYFDRVKLVPIVTYEYAKIKE